MTRSSDPPMAAIPSSALILFSVVAEKVSPVLCVIITSVWPDAARRLLLKGVRHRRQENAHAENHHHADDDGERGEKGPQFAPAQVAGGESQLEIHSTPQS